MTFQTEQDPSFYGAGETYQIEVTNLESLGFNQGFMFGCGFWLAGLVLYFITGFFGLMMFYIYTWLFT